MPELNTKSAYVALSNMDDYARMADIDPIGPRRVLEQFIIDAENAITAAYEQGKGFIEVAESVNTQAIEAIESLDHQLATVIAQRDCAVQMLADWCDAVRDNGTGWDDWDEHYKDASWRPCLVRELVDASRKPEGE